MKMRQILAAVNFPVLFGMVVIAPVFVNSVLGAQWRPSILLIQVLAGVALLRSTGNPIGSLLLAKGRADLGFYWNASIVLAPSSSLAFELIRCEGITPRLLFSKKRASHHPNPSSKNDTPRS